MNVSIKRNTVEKAINAISDTLQEKSDMLHWMLNEEDGYVEQEAIEDLRAEIKDLNEAIEGLYEALRT